MVFIFGIDIPLVELIFVMTTVLVALLVLIIYDIVNQNKLNKLLVSVLGKENLELRNLKRISEEEMKEARSLRLISKDLDRLIGETDLGKKLEAILLANQKGGKAKDVQKIKTIANNFLREVVKISKANVKAQKQAAAKAKISYKKAVKNAKKTGFPKLVLQTKALIKTPNKPVKVISTGQTKPQPIPKSLVKKPKK